MLYGLVTPTHVCGVSGLPQALLFLFLDMHLLKKVCFGVLLSIFGQYLVNNGQYLSIIINIRYMRIWSHQESLCLMLWSNTLIKATMSGTCARSCEDFAAQSSM